MPRSALQPLGFVQKSLGMNRAREERRKGGMKELLLWPRLLHPPLVLLPHFIPSLNLPTTAATFTFPPTKAPAALPGLDGQQKTPGKDTPDPQTPSAQVTRALKDHPQGHRAVDHVQTPGWVKLLLPSLGFVIVPNESCSARNNPLFCRKGSLILRTKNSFLDVFVPRDSAVFNDEFNPSHRHQLKADCPTRATPSGEVEFVP